MTTPTPSPTAKAPVSANNGAGEGGPITYAMPEYAEDVNWCERLILPEDLSTADWPAWTAALCARLRLASSSRQVADLMAMNDAGLRGCPGRFRARVGELLRDIAAHTTDQTVWS